MFKLYLVFDRRKLISLGLKHQTFDIFADKYSLLHRSEYTFQDDVTSVIMTSGEVLMVVCSDQKIMLFDNNKTSTLCEIKMKIQLVKT